MRRRVAAEIAHKLRPRFDDIGGFSEFLRIGEPVIARIGFAKIRKKTVRFVCRFPVEIAAVYDNTAALDCMSVHVFCRRMNDDVRPPFERTAEYRRRKSIVDDERYVSRVSGFRPRFEIEYRKRRIGERFSEHRFRIRFKRFENRIVIGAGGNLNTFDAELFERKAKEVRRTAVNRRTRDKAVARRTQV